MNARSIAVPAHRTLHRVNDLHSALNATEVARLLRPRRTEEVARAVLETAHRGQALAIAGGRHAMGGQQFLTGGTLLDMRDMNGIRSFDPDSGLLEVEAGIQWPELIRGYFRLQRPACGGNPAWGIRQKQTGADRLSVGGAVAANIHGRVLTAPPFIGDLESLEVVTAAGEIVRCSRSQHPGLFRHVVGGYGLFGVVTAATLRLVPRVKVQRCVSVLPVEELMPAFEARIAAGHLYGDFQFSTAPDSPEFLRTGVLSTYRPVDANQPVPADQRRLSGAEWKDLLVLAHRNKREAFRRFAAFYLATDGQLYWSDTHQLNLYLEDYHGALDRRLGAPVCGSEMITELYVPRAALPAFMNDVRRDFRANAVDFVYGTIRLIEADRESALPWARRDWACVIFNLHVDHRPQDLARAADHFRRLIDHALRHGGSYFLTYHRFASSAQREAAHPALREFLAAKQASDPREVFQSDWYRHLVL